MRLLSPWQDNVKESFLTQWWKYSSNDQEEAPTLGRCFLHLAKMQTQAQDTKRQWDCFHLESFIRSALREAIYRQLLKWSYFWMTQLTMCWKKWVQNKMEQKQQQTKTTPATGKLFLFLVTKIIPVISLAFITLVHSYIVIHCVQVMH